MRSSWVVAGLGLTGLLSACKHDDKVDKKTDEKAQTATTSAAAQEAAPKAGAAKQARDVAMALPPREKVQPVVNPKGLPAYDGPVGGVRGTITVTGDPAPDLPDVLAKMDANCDASRTTFGKVFREGPGRGLADVLVAVTGYEGYVPSQGEDVVIEAKGCAFASRTLAMTYGQRVIIRGADNRPYVPEILGDPLPAQLFVLPTMPEVSIAPKRPGRFKLVDSMRLYNVTELFVLPYRTVDVTGVDGKFEIQGIPAGSAKINALLPQTGGVTGKDVTIEPGKTIEVNLSIAFDREAWEKEPKGAPLEDLPAPQNLGAPDPK